MHWCVLMSFYETCLINFENLENNGISHTICDIFMRHVSIFQFPLFSTTYPMWHQPSLSSAQWLCVACPLDTDTCWFGGCTTDISRRIQQHNTSMMRVQRGVKALRLVLVCLSLRASGSQTPHRSNFLARAFLDMPGNVAFYNNAKTSSETYTWITLKRYTCQMLCNIQCALHATENEEVTYA